MCQEIVTFLCAAFFGLVSSSKVVVTSAVPKLANCFHLEECLLCILYNLLFWHSAKLLIYIESMHVHVHLC